MIFQKNINHLANKTLPIEAIYNSYKIIAESKGYAKKEIENFAILKTKKSITRFKSNFNYKNCVSCLSENKKTNDIPR